MPVDRGTIDEQLRLIGDNAAWWEQREFRLLPEILHPDERIQAITRGKLRRSGLALPLPAPKWLMVATNQRLICLRQERFGRKQMELRLDQIIELNHRSLLRSAQISVRTPVQRCRLRMSAAQALRFIGVLTPLVPRNQLDSPFAGTVGATGGLISRLPLIGALSSRASLPAGDFVTRDELVRVESTVERLEKDVERLQEQVDFLEDLLQKRQDGVLSLQSAAPGS